MFAAVY